ncbi:MAG: VirB4 family type IV secretion system protein, partial [Culicoidibacterales bacterium]
SLQDQSYQDLLTTSYLGKDASGGNVFLNQFANLVEKDQKQVKRTNGNTVIIGNSGSGKSTLAKKLMTMHNLQKTKIIVIDPEREYKDLCENLGGEWIDAASANGVTINPLEIQKSDDENFETMSLVGYLPILRKLGAILFRLDEYTETLFERACRETYWAFGIKNDTDISQLQSTDYPVFSDVLMTIKKILTSESLSIDEKSGYEKIRVFLENIVHGAEGRMWNQPTTLKSSSDFIVLDIHSLLDTDDRLRNAQLYLLLGWAWTQLARERNDSRSRKMLFIDEAHLLIDPHYTHALDFLRATIKRARKYNAAVVTITQQIEDFFYEDVKKYGEALFEQSTYIFIGKQSPKGVNTLTHIMELSQSERDRLQYPSRGQFLLAITNDRRMELHLRVDTFELELFGKGGGY